MVVNKRNAKRVKATTCTKTIAFVNMDVKNIIVNPVEAVEFVHISAENMFAKSVKVEEFANIIVKKDNVKNV